MQKLTFTAIILLLTVFLNDAVAQRGITYPELSIRNTAPAFFYDQTVLPIEVGDNTILHFKFAFHALNFRTVTAFERNNDTPTDAEFFSPLELLIEIQKIPTNAVAGDQTPEIKRLAWNKTVFASNYDQTQSKNQFQQGSLHLTLEPGDYMHRVFIQSDNKEIRFTSNQRRFTVPDFTKNDNLPIHFISNQSENEFHLMNLGRTVPYAEDFSALIYLGEIEESDSFTVHVDELSVSGRDTSFVGNVFSHQITPDEIIRYNAVRFDTSADLTPTLTLQIDDAADQAFAFVTIPNRTFKNSTFQLYVTKNERSFATRAFSSLWIDIPVSLLNLDVAISMMQYIVDQNTFKELRRGSPAEKETKFRTFWKERDPEPDIEYNPLMVEFYRRVDMAFERFSSPATPGYESDRGKTFLRNGEPDTINRTFPTGSPATEVWKYGNRTFVFEATTGFGDFVLVRQTRE